MTDSRLPSAHRIGGSVLDIDRGILTRDGVAIPVRPKTFDLLAHLARNPGRVVTKDELLDAVWPGVVVTEDSLTQCIRDARRAIGDEGQAVIRTVARRGYICTCEPVAPAPQAFANLVDEQPEPSVAVLPFRCDTGREGDRLVVDGLVEDITDALARFRTVVVLARSSAFAFPSDGRPDLVEVSNRLGAEFLVEGSMRRTGPRLQIGVRLVEAATGRQLWGDSYDVAEGDVLALDETIAYRIVSRLVTSLENAKWRGSRKPYPSLRAYEHLMRGIKLLRSYGPGVNERGRAELMKALEIDPDLGLAHSYVALSELLIQGRANLGGIGATPVPKLLEARDRALHGVMLLPEDGRCHRILGLVRLYLREFDAAEQHHRRALEINPYDADTVAQIGYLVGLRGRPEEGRQWLERAFRLNPLHPEWYFCDYGQVLFDGRDYAAAIRAIERVPDMTLSFRARLAAAHAMAGNTEQAARYMRAVFEEAPTFDPATYVATVGYERPEPAEHMRAAFERAVAAMQRVAEPPAA